MVQISLSAGIRSNLLSLQDNQSLLGRTQQRLGTGKRVSSPIDDPTNFFTAQALTNRASDLRGRFDGIAKGIMTTKAADTGIADISDLLKQAKGVASDARALATTATAERNALMTRFNELLVQVDSLAKDSGYDGVNLLMGDSLTVEFAERAGSSSLGLTGFNASSGESVVTIATQATGSWSDGTAPVQSSLVAMQGYLDYLNGFNSAIDDTIEQAMQGVGLDPTSESDRITSVGLFDASISQYQADIDPAIVSYSTWYAAEYPSGGGGGDPNTAIDQAIADIETSLQNLRTKAKDISADLAVLSTRKDFTNTMGNVLTNGAENLVNADLNAEAANLLSLNTQQSLGINALSLASQRESSILRLLG